MDHDGSPGPFEAATPRALWWIGRLMKIAKLVVLAHVRPQAQHAHEEFIPDL
jgi:hypothetical protein